MSYSQRIESIRAELVAMYGERFTNLSAAERMALDTDVDIILSEDRGLLTIQQAVRELDRCIGGKLESYARTLVVQAFSL